jgi:hypothetical protein
MKTPEEIDAIRVAARERFFTAQSGKPAENWQKNAVAVINANIIELAAAIDELVPHTRNKSLALTALEDVSMRANRAIFATGPNA